MEDILKNDMEVGFVNDELSPTTIGNGAFAKVLRRKNGEIISDRAVALTEDAELIYKRTIEDLQMKLKKAIRERDSMLDLSPKDAQSLILAKDFDANGFVEQDIVLGVKIRDLKIKIQIATERYNHLFVGEAKA